MGILRKLWPFGKKRAVLKMPESNVAAYTQKTVEPSMASTVTHAPVGRTVAPIPRPADPPLRAYGERSVEENRRKKREEEENRRRRNDDDATALFAIATAVSISDTVGSSSSSSDYSSSSSSSDSWSGGGGDSGGGGASGDW